LKLSFITRNVFKFNQKLLDKFVPYLLERYTTTPWANTIALGPPANVFVIEANTATCHLLQQSANALYDWVAQNLPEDLTVIKDNFEWFSCTTHDEFAYFRIC
jgi:hypothetical protein